MHDGPVAHVELAAVGQPDDVGLDRRCRCRRRRTSAARSDPSRRPPWRSPTVGARRQPERRRRGGAGLAPAGLVLGAHRDPVRVLGLRLVERSAGCVPAGDRVRAAAGPVDDDLVLRDRVAVVRPATVHVIAMTRPSGRVGRRRRDHRRVGCARRDHRCGRRRPAARLRRLVVRAHPHRVGRAVPQAGERVVRRGGRDRGGPGRRCGRDLERVAGDRRAGRGGRRPRRPDRAVAELQRRRGRRVRDRVGPGRSRTGRSAPTSRPRSARRP